MNISPLDESGKPVDWWFAYKVPKMRKDADSDSATGYEYVYYDTTVGKVVKSPFLLTDSKGALDLTLNSIFDKPDDSTGWILYNDEMPKDAKRKDNNSFGHTKGVIAFDTDSKTALWLLHSWPKFADPHAAEMPTPIYGQTFLCISLDLDMAGKIAAQMANHQVPQVYLPRIPASLDKSHPLYILAQPLNPNPSGDSDVVPCKSRGGLAFNVIAKNREWGKDFWNDLVGPTLKADMRDETWIRGKNAIPPMLDSDGIHKTFDVSFIDFRPLGMPYAWPESHDHAKWGITTDSDWVCVGDINRMISQEKRGGATIAFQDKNLWTALAKTDLTITPPGHTKAATHKLIKATHSEDNDPLSKAVARKAKTAEKTTTTKKPAAKKAVVKKVTKKKTTVRKKAAPKKTPKKKVPKKTGGKGKKR